MTNAETPRPAVQVRLDDTAPRFLLTVDGEQAGVAEFRHSQGQWIFTHTEIDPSREGQGLGSVLAKAALDHVAGTGEKVVPLCPFIRSWIERHPEYDRLVDHERTRAMLREHG